MIRIRFNPEKLELDIRGHAGYGTKGQDIVCAAVSTLFYTLVGNLFENKHMLKNSPVFKDVDGRGLVSCEPLPEYEANVYLIFRTVLVGFELLQKNFEKNVKMSLVGWRPPT